LVECTLEIKNEAAHGIVADLEYVTVKKIAPDLMVGGFSTRIYGL
jgi:hypothetical protein